MRTIGPVTRTDSPPNFPSAPSSFSTSPRLDFCLYLLLMASHRGDDLEDDFVLDDIVAYSDEEGDPGLGDGDDVGRLLSADEGEAAAGASPQEKDEKQLEKKRKRREKLKEKKVKVRRRHIQHQSMYNRSL